jgi:hypothetical protein
MADTQVGVEIGRYGGWWKRAAARLRPAPTRPAGYHVSRTTNTRPSTRARHRRTPGEAVDVRVHPSGQRITFRRP